MKAPKDNFSKQAPLYRKFRPHYPTALLEALVQLVPERQVLWDCATGNGQVAKALSPYFEQVYATDISAKQLANALARHNIQYSRQAAEATNFDAHSFDLITIGQALHWLDFERFYTEVRRVAKKEAVLAAWGYGLLRIAAPIDALIDDYYQHTIAAYWDEERRHVEAHYRSIPFPFEPLALPNSYAIEIEWTSQALEGYLNTWSSLQRYQQQHKGNPVTALMEKIRKYWPAEERKIVTFPIFTKIGRVR